MRLKNVGVLEPHSRAWVVGKKAYLASKADVESPVGMKDDLAHTGALRLHVGCPSSHGVIVGAWR